MCGQTRNNSYGFPHRRGCPVTACLLRCLSVITCNWDNPEDYYTAVYCTGYTDYSQQQPAPPLTGVPYLLLPSCTGVIPGESWHPSYSHLLSAHFYTYCSVGAWGYLIEDYSVVSQGMSTLQLSFIGTSRADKSFCNCTTLIVLLYVNIQYQMCAELWWFGKLSAKCFIRGFFPYIFTVKEPSKCLESVNYLNCLEAMSFLVRSYFVHSY